MACCILSFQWFPSVWILCAHVSEHCQFHLQRCESTNLPTYTTSEDGTDSVLKHGHIKFRCRGVTQKKEYNIQNTANVWNQELMALFFLIKLVSFCYFLLPPTFHSCSIFCCCKRLVSFCFSLSCSKFFFSCQTWVYFVFVTGVFHSVLGSFAAINLLLK